MFSWDHVEWKKFIRCVKKAIYGNTGKLTLQMHSTWWKITVAVLFTVVLCQALWSVSKWTVQIWNLRKNTYESLGKRLTGIALSNIADKFRLKIKKLFYAQGPEVSKWDTNFPNLQKGFEHWRTHGPICLPPGHSYHWRIEKRCGKYGLYSKCRTLYSNFWNNTVTL